MKLTSIISPHFKTALSVITCSAAITICSTVTADDYQKQDVLTSEQLDAYQTDGRWLGPGWWGNRLHDWSINEKKLVCSPNRPFLGWRVAHDTTRNLDLTQGGLELSLNITMVSKGGAKSSLAPDAMSGVLLGSGHSIPDPMARLLMFDHGMKKNAKVPAVAGSGYAIGFSGDGVLKIVDLDTGITLATAKKHDFSRAAQLKITADKNGSSVKLTAVSGGNHVSATIPAQRFRGGLGLISHSGTKAKSHYTLDTHFSNYTVKGGHQRVSQQSVGPIVCAQYTTDRGVLKLSAQCMPLPKGTEVILDYRPENSKWVSGGKKVIHEIDRNAVFRLENWDTSKAVPYRVSVRLPGIGVSSYTGMIAAEPKKDNLRLAALGCIIHRPWGKPMNWDDILYFPHHDLQKRVAAQKPDLVFFYGDQMYEGTPSYVDAKNIHEDYLYKWLFHCVAFKETIRNLPSITIPDDHDVYQGNHWGEGARKAPKGDWNNGGYKYSGEFIAQVHRTQTSHLPDAYEPDCLEQNVPAYHCDWNYGGMSFAVLGDRYFKSGPAGHGLPKSGTNRPDHYNNPEFDTKDLDLPGLHLLGEPQERFLAEWAADWSHGAQMKAVLSQSPFGNLATHHSGTFLIADLDGNGWPQSGRKRALEIMRAARAVHIAGDQHLSTMVQHGIQNHGDAIFSFTAPAVSNAYARAYYPGFKGSYYTTTPPKPEQYLGNRLDGFQNKVTFLAVANPDIRPDGTYTTKQQPRLNQQVPGFGIIDFNTAKHTITFHSLPRSEVVASRLKGGEYPGWPVTIKASDNDGRKPTGELARVVIKGEDVVRPVVKVYNPDGSLQSAQRMNSNNFIVYGYAKGVHTVKIDNKVIKASPKAKAETTTIVVRN